VDGMIVFTPIFGGELVGLLFFSFFLSSFLLVQVTSLQIRKQADK
jgi:hypothetical protein